MIIIIYYTYMYSHMYLSKLTLATEWIISSNLIFDSHTSLDVRLATRGMKSQFQVLQSSMFAYPLQWSENRFSGLKISHPECVVPNVVPKRQCRCVIILAAWILIGWQVQPCVCCWNLHVIHLCSWIPHILHMFVESMWPLHKSPMFIIVNSIRLYRHARGSKP